MRAREWPPTRSPYRIEPDEGPQTVEDLEVALAPWPDDVAELHAGLERAAGDEERRSQTIGTARRTWVLRTHPVIQQMLADLPDGPLPDGIPADVVWAEYDENFELRPAPGQAEGEEPGR
ncbi:hypothetical protein [Streptomyces avicenniae]|uniref:hypothetical protein n=1 Tax=Streptomyces avicenniae TaxID=500153 RepID=UPI00069AEC57|nr:hypothetical protein [Streptomyces avicenniae]